MRSVQIRRYCAGAWEERADVVAEEALVEVFVNSEHLGDFVCSPSQIRELVYGHLASAGLIHKAQEVLDYREEWDFSTAVPGERVRVRVRMAKALEIKPPSRILWNACGDVEGTNIEAKKLSPRPIFSPAGLLALPKRVLSLSKGFRETGAFHSAVLFAPDLEPLCWAEDIGRHNAVDKVIGAALLAEKDLSETLLYTTGRVSVEVVLKALTVGIPVIASPGAPLWGGIVLAQRYNLGLVGFLRGRRFNLYSGAGWFTP